MAPIEYSEEDLKDRLINQSKVKQWIEDIQSATNEYNSPLKSAFRRDGAEDLFYWGYFNAPTVLELSEKVPLSLESCSVLGIALLGALSKTQMTPFTVHISMHNEGDGMHKLLRAELEIEIWHQNPWLHSDSLLAVAKKHFDRFIDEGCVEVNWESYRSSVEADEILEDQVCGWFLTERSFPAEKMGQDLQVIQSILEKEELSNFIESKSQALSLEPNDGTHLKKAVRI